MDSNTCSNKDYTVLDLSCFSNLKAFEVSDYSFAYVNEVVIMELNHLERVRIGRQCFNGDHAYDEFGHFSLKNCEKVKELNIGHRSFSGYSVCEIEGVPSLEVIEMGELEEWGSNFFYASLVLKSGSQRMK